MTPIYPFLFLAAASPFLGSWRLAPEKSLFEPSAPPPSGKIVMTYSKIPGGVKVTATVTTPDGLPREIVHTQTYDAKPPDRFEGKPNGESLSHRRVDNHTEETSWRKDGKVMVVTTRIISDDHRTLTSVVRVPGKARPEAIMVYERQ